MPGRPGLGVLGADLFTPWGNNGGNNRRGNGREWAGRRGNPRAGPRKRRATGERGGTVRPWRRTTRSGVRFPPGRPDSRAPPDGGAFAVPGAVPGAVWAPRRRGAT